MFLVQISGAIQAFMQKSWGISRIDTFKVQTSKGAFPIEFQSIQLQSGRLLVIHRIVHLTPTGVRLGCQWRVSDFLTGRFVRDTTYANFEMAETDGIAQAGATLRERAATLDWSKYETPNLPAPPPPARKSPARVAAGSQLSFIQ